MNGEHKVTATRYIWLTFFFALVILNSSMVFYGQSPQVENVVMTITAAVMAGGSTVAVWASRTTLETSNDEKLKRGQRVKRLIDLMDDDELYELRQRLSTDYAEPPTDDYVMLGDDGELYQREKLK